MHSDIAVSVKNLTKTFRIFNHPGDRIKQALAFGRIRFHKTFTALQDISFEIRKGETFGIIGRNGSGKSTLLQLVCGILKPTRGSVEVSGGVSALLELGSGFSPEFTGRENIYFQGAVMGLAKREMDAKFDEIVAFADIGEFIDQPVRIYSSGMYVRLAFATAIHSTPDILVIDEALSVGDEPFQRKCFERIREFRARGGTIIYVSHNMPSVLELCERALHLDHGKIIATGNTKFVTSSYLRNLQGVHTTPVADSDTRSANPMEATAYFDPTLIPESTVFYPAMGARITNPRILSREGEPVNLLLRGDEYVFAFESEFTLPAHGIRFTMMIKTVSGYALGGLTSHPAGEGLTVKDRTTISQRFDFRCGFLPGTYFLNAGVLGYTPNKGEDFIHRIVDACIFKVLPEDGLLCSGKVDISPSYKHPNEDGAIAIDQSKCTPQLENM